MEEATEPPRLPLPHRGAVDVRDARVATMAGLLGQPVDHAGVVEGSDVDGGRGALDSLCLEVGDVETR
eukprot:5865656-Heterocapsa_arctica.AAC.1